jgi:DNA-binding winged helix-turn-helix (wHTH) protein/tetratricopeptide (TPR) repeat protein
LDVQFVFDGFTLDVARRELRRGGDPIQVEPQVFDVLVYLIRNRGRVVSKDDLIASIWGGRAVSDSTLTSRIFAARRALGDSADEQRLIRTVPRKGFRFVAEVEQNLDTTAPARAASPSVAEGAAPGEDAATTMVDKSEDGGGVLPANRRASLAVMPFVDNSEVVRVRGGAADALVHDVITRLAKLRSLFVIAEGTVFALHERGIGPAEAAKLLKVDYAASGLVRRSGKRLTVEVELAEVRTARIIWAESFNRTLDDAFAILDEVGSSIVASIANEIEALERNRAVLKPPNSLDAWEAYHRGLWHMYRFNKADNDQARHYFHMALRLDPTFARAHSGMSFTHFQNAFQGWTESAPAIECAYAAAAESLMADDRDPAAHWAMGRALWLRGLHHQSLQELEQAVDLSPNFAMAHYMLGFVRSQSGDAQAAIASSDLARQLSPFDPMLFGMLASRAMALVRMNRFGEAADWAVKAAARPNAHPHILALAALSQALAGAMEDARTGVALLRKANSAYGLDDFFAAFQLDEPGRMHFRRAAGLLGLK